MIPLSLAEIQILIATSVFLLGLICIVLGIFVLMTRGYSREVRSLASHTALIGRKGIAQDVAGLVQSASELVGAINQLVKTASGVGVFLIVLGLLMISGSYWVTTQLQWPL
ncbi:MAG: hypothetical protein ACLFWD_09650 [Anaerolineales bacterium]